MWPTCPGPTCSGRRSPYGERGLKLVANSNFIVERMSLPLRGARIEILLKKRYFLHCSCRSPYGERGLKSAEVKKAVYIRESLPLRGARIEIAGTMGLMWTTTVAPLTGSAD